MTGTMRAVVLTGHGDIDTLAYREDYPKPVAGPGEALIRVRACGLNNTDVNTRTGWYSRSVTTGTTAEGAASAGDEPPAWGGVPLTFPRVQGADVCGVVEAVGDGADPALIGRRVLIDTWLRDPADPMNLETTRYFGSETDGGFAEFTVAPVSNVHPIESALSDAELATFATSYVTAENMLERAGVRPGDSVLIPGASGGVGSALIQLANRRGATAVAMCSEDKAESVRAVGPAAVLPRAQVDLKGALRDAIGREKVTVVADVVGGPYWPTLIEAIARGGRYTCAGAIAGPIVPFDLRTFYLENMAFYGATVVPPGMFANLVGYIEKGEIRPLLAETWPLEKLREAQRSFIAKRHVGNIVVTP
jgi:NADPH:quinone reductase-like Zn-dependent oxidoreductase